MIGNASPESTTLGRAGRWAIRNPALALTVGLALFAATGCSATEPAAEDGPSAAADPTPAEEETSGVDRSDPRAVAQAFVDASAEMDLGGACEYLTSDSMETIATGFANTGAELDGVFADFDDVTADMTGGDQALADAVNAATADMATLEEELAGILEDGVDDCASFGSAMEASMEMLGSMFPVMAVMFSTMSAETEGSGEAPMTAECFETLRNMFVDPGSVFDITIELGEAETETADRVTYPLDTSASVPEGVTSGCDEDQEDLTEMGSPPVGDSLTLVKEDDRWAVDGSGFWETAG